MEGRLPRNGREVKAREWRKKTDGRMTEWPACAKPSWSDRCFELRLSQAYENWLGIWMNLAFSYQNNAIMVVWIPIWIPDDEAD